MVRKYLFILAFQLLFVLAATGQEPTYIHFEPEIDIPFSTTYGDIIQDSLGYIWFGTDSGLYRYDGERFERIPITSEIKDVEILNLKKDHEGTLWFTTLTGKLCYMTNEQDSVKIYNPQDYFDSLFVYRYRIQNDQIFVQTKNKNIDAYSLISFSSYRDDSSNFNDNYFAKGPFQFAFNQQDQLLVSVNFHPSGLMEFEIHSPKERVKRFLIQFRRRSTSLDFVYDQSDILLIINKTKPASIYINKPNLRKKKLYELPLTINNWYTKDDFLWFITDDGCYQYNKSTQQLTPSALKGHDIYSMLLDREGGQWYGTNGDGIYYFPKNTLLDYSDYPLLKTQKIQKIQRIPNGPYVISLKKDIVLLDPNSLHPLPGKISFKDRILDTYVLDKTIILSFGNHINTYLLNKQTFRIELNKMIPAEGKKVIPLEKNHFIIGGYSFLKKINHTSDKTIISKERVTALLKDTTTHKIWVGGVQGVYYLSYQSDGTLSEPNPLKGSRSFITMISQDPKNRIWFSTASSGLIKYENDVIHRYPFLLNNKNEKIYQISSNNPSRIWLSNFNSIFYFDIEAEEYHKLNEIQNIIKSPIISLLDQNDTLFIGTKKGLFLFTPSLPTKPVKPNIGVESVRINYKDTTIQTTYHLSHTQKNIQIKFNSIGSFNPLYKAHIYYKLNKEKTWHLANENQLSLTNLSPGSYQILAKSVTNLTQTNFNTTSIQFFIQRPFWKTIEFNLLAILLSSLLGYWWFSNKRKQIILEKNREQESEKLKSAVLQLQMNPHFIFNSMNTIIYYITVANKEKSIQILTKMSRLIRQIFNFSNKNLIPLSTELSFLSDYLDMEQERFSEKVKIVSQIDSQAHDSSFPIPPLMVQPILENSFKHGLFHKKNGGILHFIVQIKDKQVVFIVEDNGVGRKKKKSLDKKMSSYDVIGNRIKLINESQGEFANITAQFFIEDLLDNHQNPKGTKSTLIFEINQ